MKEWIFYLAIDIVGTYLHLGKITGVRYENNSSDNNLDSPLDVSLPLEDVIAFIFLIMGILEKRH
ncbi:hypothetical protein GcC1_216020 [Golovinomyces cichoracearum]|uniref:Uncharacterized protein n=1 Tax=Golovinomyces cichoracearum TaxID=62708 RepID=A0A420H8Z8_9PEZI|nr:hypothetical protein GcC1_216020 [Golovinomyces cichoracearum]